MARTARARWKGLKSVWQALLHRGPAVATPDREPDPNVVSLLETPIESVADAHHRFETLERRFHDLDDRRAVFLTIYARVTDVVGKRIDAGGFNDPDWVADYLVTFANYYRRAVYDYERGELASVPVPWQIALAAAEAGDTLYIQDAVLGINAHINYDLAFALDEVTTRPNRTAKYEDHCSIMGVLDQLVDETQERLAEEYADGIGAIDRSFGRVDEWFSVFTIDEARDNAWDRAVALDSRLRTRRRIARWVNHLTATGAAYLILSPTASSRIGADLKAIESGAWNDD